MHWSNYYFSGCKDRDAKDEIALLTLLIEKWDEIHNTFDEWGPLQILHSLMKEHDLKAKGLAPIFRGKQRIYLKYPKL